MSFRKKQDSIKSRTKFGSVKIVTQGQGFPLKAVKSSNIQSSTRIEAKSAATFALEVNEVLGQAENTTSSCRIAFEKSLEFTLKNHLNIKQAKGEDISPLIDLVNFPLIVDISPAVRLENTARLFQTKNQFIGVRYLQALVTDQSPCSLFILKYSEKVQTCILHNGILRSIRNIPKLYRFDRLTTLKLKDTKFLSKRMVAALHKALELCPSLHTYHVNDDKATHPMSLTGYFYTDEDSELDSNFLRVKFLCLANRVSVEWKQGCIKDKSESIFWLNELKKCNMFMNLNLTMPFLTFKVDSFYKVDGLKGLERTYKPYYLDREEWIKNDRLKGNM